VRHKFFKKSENTIWVFIPIFVFSFLFPTNLKTFIAGAKAEDILTVEQLQNSFTSIINFGKALTLPVPEVFSQNFPAPQLDAKSVLIYDPDSNIDLFSKNPGQKLPIASLTKIMTAIVASSSVGFNQPLKITKADQVNVSPSLHLKIGDMLLPSDLLKAMLVGSANDAAQTLANHFPDQKDFIAEMNSRAKELGMNDTHFSTPIGFDAPDNYSSAADLKKLVNFAINYLPYSQIWDKTDYFFVSQSGIKYSISNSNSLVWNHPNIKSIKTGNTAGALGSMIVLANNPFGEKIISVVLDSSHRETDTLSAVNYAFKNFSWKD
jgi:D-alanyl-D-alanine carboxypeptidase